MKIQTDGVVARVVTAIVGASVALVGYASMARGFGVYRNWFGQPVFGPFAMFIGVIVIFGTIHSPTWKKMNRKSSRRAARHLSDHELFLNKRKRSRTRFRWTQVK